MWLLGNDMLGNGIAEIGQMFTMCLPVFLGLFTFLYTMTTIVCAEICTSKPHEHSQTVFSQLQNVHRTIYWIKFIVSTATSNIVIWSILLKQRMRPTYIFKNAFQPLLSLSSISTLRTFFVRLFSSLYLLIIFCNSTNSLLCN